MVKGMLGCCKRCSFFAYSCSEGRHTLLSFITRFVRTLGMVSAKRFRKCWEFTQAEFSKTSLFPAPFFTLSSKYSVRISWSLYHVRFKSTSCAIMDDKVWSSHVKPVSAANTHLYMKEFEEQSIATAPCDPRSASAGQGSVYTVYSVVQDLNSHGLPHFFSCCIWRCIFGSQIVWHACIG